MSRKKTDQKFEDVVEKGIQKMLAGDLTTGEKIKLLSVAVRWAAVKARVVLPDQGAGFFEEEEDDPPVHRR